MCTQESSKEKKRRRNELYDEKSCEKKENFTLKYRRQMNEISCNFMIALPLNVDPI